MSSFFAWFSLHYFVNSDKVTKTPQKEREVAIPPFPLDFYPTQTPTRTSSVSVKTDIIYFCKLYCFATRRRRAGVGMVLRKGEGVVRFAKQKFFGRKIRTSSPLLKWRFGYFGVVAKVTEKIHAQTNTHVLYKKSLSIIYLISFPFERAYFMVFHVPPAHFPFHIARTISALSTI